MAGKVFKLPEGTHTVALGIGDLNGIMRGKRIPSTHWETDLQIRQRAVDRPVRHRHDLRCLGHALCQLRQRLSRHAHVSAHGAGRPAVGAGRGFLHGPRRRHGSQAGADRSAPGAGAPGRAGRLRWATRSMSARNWNSICSIPETLQPRDSGIQVYSLARAAEMEHVLGPIRQQINETGIPIEQSNPEYAPGQVEVNIRYGEALSGGRPGRHVPHTGQAARPRPRLSRHLHGQAVLRTSPATGSTPIIRFGRTARTSLPTMAS